MDRFRNFRARRSGLTRLNGARTGSGLPVYYKSNNGVQKFFTANGTRVVRYRGLYTTATGRNYNASNITGNNNRNRLVAIALNPRNVGRQLRNTNNVRNIANSLAAYGLLNRRGLAIVRGYRSKYGVTL
jgi:hypothetical protein